MATLPAGGGRGGGKVKLSQMPVEFDDDDWGFVLELYEIASSVKTSDILRAYERFRSRGFEVKRFPTTALAIFDSYASAQEALTIVHPRFSSRPIQFASEETKVKIRDLGLHFSMMPASAKRARGQNANASTTTSKGLKITPEIRNLCDNVDMCAVVEALSASELPVSRRVDAFLDIIALTPAELTSCLDVVARLEACFRPVYPNCVARLFGSCVAGLALKGSDLDVYMDMGISDPALRKRDAEYVKEAAEIMRKHASRGFENIRKIPRARVPIIKLYCLPPGVSVDVSFGNSMGVVNSTLIKSYVDYDPDVRRFVQLVRWWARVRGLSGRRSHFTSYSVVWLALFYLMTRDGAGPRVPPVARVLEAARLAGTVTSVEGWECGVAAVRAVPEVAAGYPAPGSGEPLVGVLEDFFKFYSDYDFGTVVICPLTGRALPRALFGAPAELLPKELAGYVEAMSRPNFAPLDVDYCFVTQDPFRLDQNLNRSAKISACEKFMDDCKRSLFALRQMAPGTPQEGVFALLQVALGDAIARRFGPAVYNGNPIPRHDVVAPEHKDFFLTFGQCPAVATVVRTARDRSGGGGGGGLALLATLGHPELRLVHTHFWRELAVQAAARLLVDGLLFDTWDLSAVADARLLDGPATAAAACVSVPAVRSVSHEGAAVLLNEGVCLTDSGQGTAAGDGTLLNWLSVWSLREQAAFGHPGSGFLPQVPLVPRSARVSTMISRAPQVKNGVLVKRFYCEARWPTHLARRRGQRFYCEARWPTHLARRRGRRLPDAPDGVPQPTQLDVEAEWSSVVARMLSGDAADQAPLRPPPRFGYVVEFFSVTDMPFNGLLVRALWVPLSPLNGALIGDVTLEYTLASFVRNGVIVLLRDAESGRVSIGGSVAAQPPPPPPPHPPPPVAGAGNAVS